MRLRNRTEKDCICKRYAKKVVTTYTDIYGSWKEISMAYYPDKECKGRAFIDPRHTIRKSQAQILSGVPVWCEIVPGVEYRTANV